MQARILASEAEKQELINAAEGSAKAVVAAGEARAKSIELVAKVSSSKSHQIVRGRQSRHHDDSRAVTDEIFTAAINYYPVSQHHPCTLTPTAHCSLLNAGSRSS